MEVEKMKIYSNEEAKKLIENGKINVKGDIELYCDIDIDADIKCRDIVCPEGKRNIRVIGNIYARNIDVLDINTMNIDALNIEALDIDAEDIDAGDINARNIDAGDIEARNIDAADIEARNIEAADINTWDINARNIDAADIEAADIDARDIEARNIEAGDINAGDISYYAVCFTYRRLKCKSIHGRRENSKHFCLDGEIEIKEEVE